MKEIIAVIHLPRLPSSCYKSEIGLDSIIDNALKEARILEELGYVSVIVENYGDKPYKKHVKDPLTISFMSVIVREIIKNTSLKVGINLLRNSGKEAYSIALATGAKFIRVNSLVETIVADSGLIEPEAPRMKTLRLNYPSIEVYADIMVKHASSLRLTLSLLEAESSLIGRGLAEEHIETLVKEYVDRGDADKLVVTGPRTGIPPHVSFIDLIKKYSGVPLIVGSGANPENLREILKRCDGIIVGSYIKKEGRAGNPLDLERAKTFINAFRNLI